MHLRALFSKFLAILIALNMSLVLFSSVSLYELRRKRIIATRMENLDHTYSLFRSELIGNLLLNDRELVEETLRKIWMTREISSRLEGRLTLSRGQLDEKQELVGKTFLLDFGGQKLGTLNLAQAVEISIADFLMESYVPILGMLLTGFSVIWLLFRMIRVRLLHPLERLTKDIRQNNELNVRDYTGSLKEIYELSDSIVSMRRAIAKLSIHEAIATMTQMLAHDVRKPFSIMQVGLNMLQRAQDPQQMHKVLSGLLPEIDQAVSSVNGMIADIIEIGSTSTQLMKESCDPEKLIESTLSEMFRVVPQADVEVRYEFQHSHSIHVHVHKVSRVFSNIIDNALQAMRLKGEIWFRTWEEGAFMGFCLGNRGSFIPEESLPQLFEAFFTSGKKTGTGLGLAIAQKVVHAHGGRIWCQSRKDTDFPDGVVEFFFTLPLGDALALGERRALPQHSSDFLLPKWDPDHSLLERSIEKSEGSLEADIIRTRHDLGRPIRILVVDDESIYRKALANYLSMEREDAIHIIQAKDSKEALAAAEKESFDLVISDFDMGEESLDGLELAKQLVEQGKAGRVCIHSNRIFPSELMGSSEALASAFFIPKPMARAQLLRIVLQAAQKKAGLRVAEPGLAPSFEPVRPELLIIDDSLLTLKCWKSFLEKDTTVHLAENLEALEKLLAQDPQILGRLTAVVCDLYFDNSQHSGLSIGRFLKERRQDLPVLLSSNATVNPAEHRDAIDRVIAKKPLDWLALRLHLERGDELRIG